MSIDTMILPLLLIIPFIGTIATLAMGGERQKLAKVVAGVFSVITLVLTIYLMWKGEMENGYVDFPEECRWMRGWLLLCTA